MRKFLLCCVTLVALTIYSFGQQTFTVEGVQFKMVKVEKGDYWMGAQCIDTTEVNYDFNAQSDEWPIHFVTIPEDFLIGQTEVTQKLWKKVMGYNPSRYKCCRRPVENVSLDEIMVFLQRLDSLTNKDFRLPTEEEWEYAARGGKDNPEGDKQLYSGGDDLRKLGWYNENSRHPRWTKRKNANKIGAYDMSGNVWEWTQTPYAFYDKERKVNAEKGKTFYVIRGGSWNLNKNSCRVSWRGKRYSDSGNSFGGFRLVLPLTQQNNTEKE